MMPIEPTTSEMTGLVQRLFRLRHRFRVGLPENITDLKKRLFQTTHGLPVDNNNFDLFFSVGSLLSGQPEPIAMGDLSRSLNVPLSTATRMVDWMVNNDYARRLPDPNDRRVVLVTLTGTGSAMYREINAFFMERVERLMRGFTPEERSSLRGIIQKIVNTLEQEAW